MSLSLGVQFNLNLHRPSLQPAAKAQRLLARPSKPRSRSTCVKAVAVAPGALTPFMPALYGGLSLGVLAVTKYIVSGRILAVSGAVKGIINGDTAPFRYLFLMGLLAGGFALSTYYPAAFEALPASVAHGSWRYLLAGFLVGVGTHIGNGCTSGHGICGNARLSARSFVSTLTFMATGAIAAASFGTAMLYNVPSGIIVAPTPAPELLALGKLALVASVSLLAVVSVLAKLFIKRETDGACSRTEEPAAVWIDRLATLAIGFLFALGLGASGMLKPSIVGGFLSVLSGTFNPTLMFVMGGALAVSLPGFQLVQRTGFLRKPLCCDEFTLPSAKAIDWQLLLGAALFGAGWGAAGICPGPGIVSLATAKTPVLQFIGALVVGMFAVSKGKEILAQRKIAVA